MNLQKKVSNKDPRKQKEAIDWFKDTFNKSISNSTSANSILNAMPTNQKKSTVKPGNLYIFNYEAITKGLPYWDSLPLVIPFSEDNKHFWGINLHYAPNMFRARILDMISHIINNPLMPEIKKRALLVNEISKIARMPMFQPLVKCYLKTQVQSSFVEVPHDTWEHVIHLPLARFNGASVATVHKDFNKKRRK